MRLVFLITVIFYSLKLPAAAIDDPTPVFTFETIEVTAEAIDITGTGNRVGLPSLDSPESSTVIDDEITDEQQANTIDEILKNDASISNQGSFGTTSSFSSRGFTLNNSGNYLRNGLLYFFWNLPTIETIDRVEILKGPASFLYGAGAPGGVINFMTKKPIDENFNNGGIQIGSYDYYRAYADLNRTTENLDYRVNLAAADSRSFRDKYFQDRQIADFSLTGDPTDNTESWFNMSFQNSDQPQDTGLVAIGDGVADLPRNTYLNQDWTKTERSSFNTTLDSFTDLFDAVKLHSALYYQYIDRERILSNIVLQDNESGHFKYSFQYRKDTWQFYTGLLEMIAEKELLGFDQKFLLGTTYAVMDHDILEAKSISSSEVYSIYDVPTLPKVHFHDFNDPTTVMTNNFGFYAQDVIQLHEQWELIAGARFDHYQSDSSNLSESSANHTSPHLALLYKPLYFWSTYITYSEGFEFNEPVSDNNAINFGEELDPTLSEQIEIGTKMELFNEKQILSAAVFDILRFNQPFTEDIDGDDPNDVVVVQRGEQRHQGLELGVQGHPSDNITLLSTLMWLDARFSESNDPAIAGNRPAAVPEIAATLWGEYRFTKGKWNNFALNAGIFYEGDRFGDDQNTFILDAYSRIDSGLAYY